MKFAARLFDGYRSLLVRLGVGSLVVALVLAIGLAVVLPLWYLAMFHRQAYGLAVISALLAGLVYLSVQRVRRDLRRFGGWPAYWAGGVAPALRRALAVMSALSGLAACLFLLSALGAAAAAAGGLALLFLLGAAFFPARRDN